MQKSKYQRISQAIILCIGLLASLATIATFALGPNESVKPMHIQQNGDFNAVGDRNTIIVN